MADKNLVIAGLGNPGKQYEVTRHNLGYLVVKAFARRQGWNFKEDKRINAFISRNPCDDVMVHLVLPTTYMNNSGAAVRQYLDYYKLTPESLVVVTDDIALPYGQLRVRPEGSAGGHNGLKSVEAYLGTQNYARLRMGIGDHRQSAEPAESLADYVLGDFTRHELDKLEEFIDQGAQILMRLVKEPLVNVMNNVNKSLKPKRIEANPQQQGQENKNDSTT